jgi:RHS repeat-associated protein
MTGVPSISALNTNNDLTYDAWNRLVKVKAGATELAAYEYDGLGRVIIKLSILNTQKREYFYNEQWQVVEERGWSSGAFSANPLSQYIWHPYYIDALAVRYYDDDMDNNLAEGNDGTHYYAQDANFNVTAVVNAGGTVLERYLYSPYGTPTILDADFAPDGDNFSDIENTHLYTGREYDSFTGLQLNRNRFYAAHMGRWVTRDPIGYEGGTLNLFEYARSAPLYSLDPNGTAQYYCEKYDFTPFMRWLDCVVACPSVAAPACVECVSCLKKFGKYPGGWFVCSPPCVACAATSGLNLMKCGPPPATTRKVCFDRVYLPISLPCTCNAGFGQGFASPALNPVISGLPAGFEVAERGGSGQIYFLNSWSCNDGTSFLTRTRDGQAARSCAGQTCSKSAGEKTGYTPAPCTGKEKRWAGVCPLGV